MSSASINLALIGATGVVGTKIIKLLEKKWIENKFNIEQDIIEKFLEKKTKN